MFGYIADYLKNYKSNLINNDNKISIILYGNYIIPIPINFGIF